MTYNFDIHWYSFRQKFGRDHDHERYKQMKSSQNIQRLSHTTFTSCSSDFVADPWGSLFVPLLSFFGSLYYLSFFDLRIAITIWYISPLTYVWSSLLVNLSFDLRIAITFWNISPLTYVWSSLLVKNKYVVPYWLPSDK